MGKKRSIGVTILGWIYIAATILAYILTLYLFLVKGRSLQVMFRGMPVTGQGFKIMGYIIVFILINLPALLGIGLLLLKKWARLGVLVFAWLGIANTIWLFITKARIAIPLFEIFIIWFFNRGIAKEQFK